LLEFCVIVVNLLTTMLILVLSRLYLTKDTLNEQIALLVNKNDQLHEINHSLSSLRFEANLYDDYESFFPLI